MDSVSDEIPFSCQIVRLYLLSSPAAPVYPSSLGCLCNDPGLNFKCVQFLFWIWLKRSDQTNCWKTVSVSIQTETSKKVNRFESTDPSPLCTAVLTLSEFCCCYYSNAAPLLCLSNYLVQW